MNEMGLTMDSTRRGLVGGVVDVPSRCFKRDPLLAASPSSESQDITASHMTRSDLIKYGNYYIVWL